MKRRNKIVCIDADGVLADFEKAFCEKFGYNKRDAIDLEFRYPDRAIGIKKFVDDPKTYAELDVIPLGKEIADYVKSLGFEIAVVSSRPTSAYVITRQWLIDCEIPFDVLFVQKSDKIKKIKSLFPLCVIDDMPLVLEECKKAKIPGILIGQPWNEDMPRGYRVFSMEEFDEDFVAVLSEILVNGVTYS